MTEQIMRKFMITALSLGVMLYFFLAEVGKPVDEPSLDVAVTQPETESGFRLADLSQKFDSSLTDNLSAAVAAGARTGESLACSQNDFCKSILGVTSTWADDARGGGRSKE